MLQAKSRYSIDRVCISGSAGKKTTITGSDYDVVLFINGRLPPFKDVLNDFEDILNATDSYHIREVRTTRFSIQFKALNFEFDFLPATNFAQGIQGDIDQIIRKQKEELLKRIKEDPEKNGYMYSSSLAEATIDFIKRQDSFAHQMMRIAKTWYKSLHFEEYISGAKYCIELIAVHAANKENDSPKKEYLRAFRCFIGDMQKFDNLDIHFEENGNSHQWNGYQHRPRVIDPANPYNNLAKLWDRSSIEKVKRYANETARRLELLAERRIQFTNLFEPQPSTLPFLVNTFKSLNSENWVIGIEEYSGLPDLKIQNEKFGNDRALRSCLDILKRYFPLAIHTAMASPNGDVSQAKGAVTKTIDAQVLNRPHTQWSPGFGHQQGNDFTFTIPASNHQAIRVSYRSS